MIYKVLIADDEPPFIRSLKRMLDKYAANFQVVGEAFNGVEALEKVHELHPDIVFTDIKMPGMDGIELIQKIELEMPETLCVIISGYQDFNYARQAMKTIAVEYLLKPLEAELLSEVLLSLADKLDDRMFVKEQALLQGLSDGSYGLSEKDKALFAGKNCWTSAALCFAGTQEAIECCKRATEELIWVPKRQSLSRYLVKGADKEEQVVIIACRAGEGALLRQILRDIVTQVFEIAQSNQAFVTVAAEQQLTGIDQLGEQIKQRREALRAGICIGKSQHIEQADSLKGAEARLLDTVLQNNLRFLLQNKQLCDVSHELDKLCTQWEMQGYTKAVVKQMLAQLLMLAQEASTGSCSALLIERQLDLACNESCDYGELKKAILEIIERVLEDTDQSNNREERQRVLITKMSEYVLTNLGQSISLQTISNAFALSQPTVSRLFREYFGVSFNEYLTALRMNHAKRLMKERKDMRLHAIAEIVGYGDPHYFSRKFKQVTGKSPSEFLTAENDTQA